MARARWVHGEIVVRAWYAAECFPAVSPWPACWPRRGAWMSRSDLFNADDLGYHQWEGFARLSQ